MAEQEISMQEPPFTQDSPTLARTVRDSGIVFTNQGYQPLPTEEDQQRPSHHSRSPPHQPPRYSPAAHPTSVYAPAPGSFSTQQATNTSVVMSQPGAAPQLTTVEVRRRAPENMIITVVLLTVVGIVNPTTLLCFCPAFIFASLAVNQNNHGTYQNARAFGLAAGLCNVIAIVYTAMLIIGTAIVILIAWVELS